MNSPIKDVSDTAFWIAHHRRLESERSNALFHDPFAARLAGERGKRISEAMPTSRVVAWTVALRTRIIDEYLQFAINSGVDTVLSLGAGLDARPCRMNLPASLRWIEADYPQILDYKASQLQADEPRCQLERVQIDLADRERRRQLLARINAQTHGILVLTEGLIPYLDNDEVASLADDLFASGSAISPRKPSALGRPFPAPLPLRLLMASSRLWLSPERQNVMRRFAGCTLLERTDPSAERPAGPPAD